MIMQVSESMRTIELLQCAEHLALQPFLLRPKGRSTHCMHPLLELQDLLVLLA